MNTVFGAGQLNADVMIVGEFPDYDEDKAGKPFVGGAGHELTKILADAGIVRAECYLTHAVRVRPPEEGIDSWISNGKKIKNLDDIRYLDRWVRPFIKPDIEELFAVINTVKPKVIIAMGDIALWALTGKNGCAKWRGSQLKTALDRPLLAQYSVVPTYHPATILKQWKLRQISVMDVKRARREVIAPNRPHAKLESYIKPDFADTMAYLSTIEISLKNGPTPLVIDLEIKRGAILCAGLAIAPDFAFCLPFWHDEPTAPTAPLANYSGIPDFLGAAITPAPDAPRITKRYWPFTQELDIILRLRAIMIHPNCQLINQNIGFDLQFITSYWLCLPTAYFDTMVAQHVMLPGTPKALDHLHSIYGKEYVYWKDDNKMDDDDGKFWKDNAKVNYPALWKYNCQDCLTTFEIFLKQKASIVSTGLQMQMKLQMRKLNIFAIVMFNGLRINEKLRPELHMELLKYTDWLRYEVSWLTMRDLNPSSPKQIAEFFYGDMRMKPILSTVFPFNVTTNDEALKLIGERDPLLEPITTRLNLIKSLKTSLTIVNARTSVWTKRWHPNYKTAGTETFRCSSSKNVWDEGANMQNITSGKEIAK